MVEKEQLAEISENSKNKPETGDYKEDIFNNPFYSKKLPLNGYSSPF